jgi:alpha-1,2-mannosyltransferase
LFASHIVMLVPNGADIELRWGLGWSILGNAYVIAAAGTILGLAVREVRMSSPVARLAK